MWQDYLDAVDTFTKTHNGRRIYSWRKQTIERFFAETKVNHGLRFARMLGIRNRDYPKNCVNLQAGVE